MKTWEMIKELTENPDKKFISRNTGIFAELKAYHFIGNYQNKTIEIINNETQKPITLHHLDREWEEVKEPVDFMTAVSSGKYIKVEHHLTTYEEYWYYRRLDLLMLDLADSFNEGEFAEILENGKWYIED